MQPDDPFCRISSQLLAGGFNQPTGKDIRVPLAVSYELENGLIKRARIYLMANILFDQIKPAATQ